MCEDGVMSVVALTSVHLGTDSLTFAFVYASCMFASVSLVNSNDQYLCPVLFKTITLKLY